MNTDANENDEEGLCVSPRTLLLSEQKNEMNETEEASERRNGGRDEREGLNCDLKTRGGSRVSRSGNGGTMIRRWRMVSVR